MSVWIEQFGGGRIALRRLRENRRRILRRLPGSSQSKEAEHHKFSRVTQEQTGDGSTVGRVGRNILANFLGGAWNALLILLTTPLYVKVLGMEAYGLIGFMATLQVISGIFDFGLSATITRAVALDKSEHRLHSRKLIQTASTLYWGVALLMGLIISLQAKSVADHWFTLSALSPETVTLGVLIIAWSVALRWPVSLYMGVVSGLQRQETLNFLKSILVSIRLLGGVSILLISADLTLLLAWTALSSLIEVVVFMIACCRFLPGLSLLPSVFIHSLSGIWKFSLGMNLIAISAVILTQTDRILISKLLPLELLGYYFLAYNTAIGMTQIQNAINTAMFPSLASDFGNQKKDQLLVRYDKAAQISIYLTALPTFILIFFGHDLLRMWIDLDAANGASSAMGILAAGFLIHTVASNAYIIAIALGHVWLPLIVNVVGLLFHIPLLYGLISFWGIYGASIGALCLSLYYFFILIPIVSKRILRQEVVSWTCKNILPCLLFGAVSFGGVRAIFHFTGEASLFWVGVGCCLAAGVYVVGGFYLLSPSLRNDFLNLTRELSRNLIRVPASQRN